MTKKHLLVLNSGSSSLKFAVFEVAKKLEKNVLSGEVGLENSRSVLSYQIGRKKHVINYQSGHKISAWWDYIEGLLNDYQIKYIGFRMVHGGEEFVETTKVDKAFLSKIKKYNKLAPLHNPQVVELISLVKESFERVKMSVSFDTAWHRDLEPAAYLYSLPVQYYQKYAIRKYGFHGLSHQAATEYTAELLNKKLNKLKVITCHLGAGSSLTWFENGKVKDTTMGFSPNEGLTMATRSGDIPPSVVFYLEEELKITKNKIKELLNENSGLKGLTGTGDLREVLTRAGYKVAGYKKSKKPSKEQKIQAKLALEVYIYDIKRYLASYLAMSKNIDAVVFTGAIGQNSQIVRKLVLKGINKPKNCKILVAPSQENKNLAQKTLLCLK